MALGKVIPTTLVSTTRTRRTRARSTKPRSSTRSHRRTPSTNRRSKEKAAQWAAFSLFTLVSGSKRFLYEASSQKGMSRILHTVNNFLVQITKYKECFGSRLQLSLSGPRVLFAVFEECFLCLFSILRFPTPGQKHWLFDRS